MIPTTAAATGAPGQLGFGVPIALVALLAAAMLLTNPFHSFTRRATALLNSFGV